MHSGSPSITILLCKRNRPPGARAWHRSLQRPTVSFLLSHPYDYRRLRRTSSSILLPHVRYHGGQRQIRHAYRATQKGIAPEERKVSSRIICLSGEHPVESVGSSCSLRSRVETVFLYLPKTTPPSTRPPSWYHYTSAAGSSNNPNPDVKIPIEPAGDRSQKEWKTMTLASGIPVPNLAVEVWFPYQPSRLRHLLEYCHQFSLLKPLVYQARSPIPFSLTVSSTSPVLPDLILSCAQVTLLRCTTIHASGQTYQHEEVIGTADFGKPESPSEAQSQSKVVRVSNGCIEGGKEQGEIVWSVDGMVEVNVREQSSFSCCSG